MLRRARSGHDLTVVRDIEVNSKQDVEAAVDSGFRYVAMIKEGGRGKEVKCASKWYANIVFYDGTGAE